MHKPVTSTELQQIAARFGVLKSAAEAAIEADRANGLIRPVTDSERDAASRLRDYALAFSNSLATGFRDPRETAAYWYVQEANDAQIEALAAADFEERAYGRD